MCDDCSFVIKIYHALRYMPSAPLHLISFRIKSSKPAQKQKNTTHFSTILYLNGILHLIRPFLGLALYLCWLNWPAMHHFYLLFTGVTCLVFWHTFLTVSIFFDPDNKRHCLLTKKIAKLIFVVSAVVWPMHVGRKKHYP